MIFVSEKRLLGILAQFKNELKLELIASEERTLKLLNEKEPQTKLVQHVEHKEIPFGKLPFRAQRRILEAKYAVKPPQPNAIQQFENVETIT